MDNNLGYDCDQKQRLVTHTQRAALICAALEGRWGQKTARTLNLAFLKRNQKKHSKKKNH